jgi:hypothetical protein
MARRADEDADGDVAEEGETIIAAADCGQVA